MMDPSRAHVERLVAQCPARPEPVNADALPIDEDSLGEGDELLFVHGGVQGAMGGGPSSFGRQRALARQGFRVTLIARPGFGKSPSRGVDDMVRDVRWLAPLMNDRHVIGHSFGAGIALMAASQSRPRSLVLIEPPLFPILALEDLPPGPNPNLEMLAKSVTPADYGMAFATDLSGGSDGGRASILRLLQNKPELAAELGCSLLQARFPTPDTIATACAHVGDARIPLRCITGGWSPGFDLVGRVLARRAGGTHEVFATPDHFVHVHEGFNEHLATIIRHVG